MGGHVEANPYIWKESAVDEAVRYRSKLQWGGVHIEGTTDTWTENRGITGAGEGWESVWDGGGQLRDSGFVGVGHLSGGGEKERLSGMQSFHGCVSAPISFPRGKETAAAGQRKDARRGFRSPFWTSPTAKEGMNPLHWMLPSLRR